MALHVYDDILVQQQSILTITEEFISNLARKRANELKEITPNALRWKDKSVKLMDGSTVSMPDTPENQAIYPQPRTQKKAAGFPLARNDFMLS